MTWFRRPDDHVPRHAADGEGNVDQPRTGRHTPEYIAAHEVTRRMIPLGQARRVPPNDYDRDA